MQKRPLHLLLHPLFLFSLFLLLLNDIYLKYAFSNWFTGKLSDFAGLFAFSVFLIVILPSKKTPVLIFSALFFTWWKSTLSQSFIDGFNNFSPVEINRTIDYTDLIALSVLPFANLFAQLNEVNTIQRKLLINVSALISLFAFCFTSVGRTLAYSYPPNRVSFYYSIKTKKTEEDILKKLSSLQLKYSKDSVHFYRLSAGQIYLRQNASDTQPQWKAYPNYGDSVLYMKDSNTPFYTIPSFQVGDDRITNFEFRFLNGKRKNWIEIISFETSAHQPSDFYQGKLKRKYKKHFKDFFQ